MTLIFLCDIIYYNIVEKGVGIMEIYYSGENVFMCAIYAICTVLFAIVPFIVIVFLNKQIIAYRKSGLKFPTFLYSVFVLVALVPMLGVWGFGKMFTQTVSYNYNMKNGDALYLAGDVEVLICEEADYRGDFLGYTVEISVNGEKIAPCNTFSKDIIEYFNSDKELIIQYGIIEGDGVYIWSIKTAED